MAKEAALRDRVNDAVELIAAECDVQGAALALVDEVVTMVREYGADPAQVAAVADALEGARQRLAGAVVVNTPAAPGP